jgi:hypothetical protein
VWLGFYYFDGPNFTGHQIATSLGLQPAQVLTHSCMFITLSACAVQKGSVWWGTYDFDGQKFDWGSDYNRPRYSLSELVIYEMSVRCFTASETSGLSDDRRGTYLGVAEKVRVRGSVIKAVHCYCYMVQAGAMNTP